MAGHSDGAHSPAPAPVSETNAGVDALGGHGYDVARTASVAQLDRVLPSEGRGRGFESRRVHHLLSLVLQGDSAPDRNLS